MHSSRRYLGPIPLEELTQAKAVGARWDGLVKRWWVPMGVPIAMVARWIEAPPGTVFPAAARDRR